MSDDARPARVRLKLLESAGARVAAGAAARRDRVELLPPPSATLRVRRTLARIARMARTRLRAIGARSRELVVPIETDAGARRRAHQRTLARQLALTLPTGWHEAAPDRLERGQLAIPLRADDGAALTLVLEPRRAERAAFRTEHFSVSYRPGARPLDAARLAQMLAWAEAALRVAERTLGTTIEGFPRSLFATDTTQLEYYPREKRIELRPTLACDHFCDFCCSVDHATTTNALRGLRELRETRARWQSLPIRHVTISGGEPTLLADLPLLIAELANDGYEVELQTNGMALDDLGYAQSLANAGLRRVLVSLHSADARVSDETITHHPGAWARTTRGIDHAISVGLRPELSHVVSRANQDRILAFLQFVDARWGRRVRTRMAFVSPTGDASTDPDATIPALDTVAPALREALAFAERRRLRLALIGYCGVPPCLVAPYEHFSEVTRRAATVYTETRLQLDACRQCDYASACPGLWRGYYAKHGDPGLTPLRRKRRY
jgi:MoaA/NifB/PqqE/SkfB family radical SAM enzyme